MLSSCSVWLLRAVAWCLWPRASGLPMTILLVECILDVCCMTVSVCSDSLCGENGPARQLLVLVSRLVM